MKTKLLIHLKPFIHGIHNGITTIKPTYGISKVAVINGALTYIATPVDSPPVYIPERWVQKREVVS